MVTKLYCCLGKSLTSNSLNSEGSFQLNNNIGSSGIWSDGNFLNMYLAIGFAYASLLLQDVCSTSDHRKRYCFYGVCELGLLNSFCLVYKGIREKCFRLSI